VQATASSNLALSAYRGSGCIAWNPFVYCRHIRGPASGDCATPRQFVVKIALCGTAFATQCDFDAFLSWYGNEQKFRNRHFPMI